MNVSRPSETPDRQSSPQTAPGDDASRVVRTQFLRRVAHDIASPTGVTLTVLEEIASAEAGPRPELMGMARRSLRRLMRLSEHLALVAELEAGALEPELSVADLRAVARQALDDALAIDGRKDVVASCDLPSSALFVEGDSRLLLVIFREVIGNALKLATSRVQVSLATREGRAVLRVDDDGPGFAEEARSSIGRRFVHRAAGRGLGLSLSMATEILRAHGGDLSIATSALAPGRRGARGAAVVLELPASAPEPRGST